MALISREYCLRNDRGRACIIHRLIRRESEKAIAKSLKCSEKEVYDATQAFLHKWRTDGKLITSYAGYASALRNWSMTAPGLEGGTVE